MPLPRLVLVSGVPASGKTTLAHQIGRHVPCPVISRDEVKEGLVHASGEKLAGWGGPISVAAFKLFYRVVGEFLDAGCSVVAEAAFMRDRARAEVLELVERADACVVHCEIDRLLSRDRFLGRAASDPVRSVSHADLEIAESVYGEGFDWSTYEPLELDVPVLRVNTTDGYEPSLDRIVTFSRGGEL